MLPSNTSWTWKERLLSQLHESWRLFAQACFEDIASHLRDAYEERVKALFGHYSEGQLAADVS